MHQRVLQSVLNCTPVQKRIGTLISLRREFFFLHLLFVGTPSYAFPRRILNSGLPLPSVSLKRNYSTYLHLYGQPAESYLGCEQMLGRQGGVHILNFHDQEQRAHIRLYESTQIGLMFFRFVFDKINSAEEYLSSLRELFQSCLRNIVHLFLGSQPKFHLCSP